MRVAVLVFLLAAVISSDDSPAQDRFARERGRMVVQIEYMARETGAETGRPQFAQRVMQAMRKVPRHRFVPASEEARAYENRPLPIGQGQTISQPYIVALMTELLDSRPTDIVLEVGTGSGYQAAVLAELVTRVYTIEIVEPLGRQAAQTLSALGYANVFTRLGDGYGGWPDAAPFDSIVVTAAAADVPKPLVDQMKPGGRLVIPVGGRSDIQQLMVIQKNADGTTLSRKTLPVRFVPLVRGK